MATCSTGSMFSSAPATRYSAQLVATGNSFNGATYGVGVNEYSQWGYSAVTENTAFDGLDQSWSGSWTGGSTNNLNADTTYKYRARVLDHQFGTYANGTTKNKKTGAVVATANTPTSSSVTATTATIACQYYPNVDESTCSGQLYYKKSSDSTWTSAGTANATGGYSIVTESENLTGLTPSTQYQYKLVITRTTQTGTSAESAISTFTTLAGAPTVTTDAASGIGATGATLNGTLDINSGTSVQVYFTYGPAGNEEGTTTTKQDKTVDGAFSQAIAGLTASTQYFFRAYADFVTPSGSPASGTQANFTTSADPGADAANQELIPILNYDRKYGVATTVYFVVANAEAAASYDTFYTGQPLWDGAGECKISKDGAAFADTTADPAQVSGALYSLALSAAELQCSEAYIVISNGGTTVRDVYLRVRTHVQLGSVDIDAATGSKANTTGLKLTGYGSGHGINAIAGATGHDIDGQTQEMVLIHHTLPADIGGTDSTHIDFTGASGLIGSNDAYNGDIVAIIGGTGAGQARMITDYVTATALATVDAWTTTPATGSVFIVIPGPKDWNVGPGAELSAMPTYADGYGDLLQFLFQRFVYTHDQTAVNQTMYKDNGTTAIGTSTFEDTGTGQIVGEVK